MATRKVCLPKAKIASMSSAEKSKVVNAKKSAANQGKQKRSSKSNVKSARKPGATLRDWFKKEDWKNVETGEDCGAPAAYGKKKLNFGRKKGKKVRKTTKGKNRNFLSTKEGAGMTSKGVKRYRKNNPGSKLKTAVTGKVKPGSKAAKRRKSFCARSKSWTGPRGKAARKRWKC